MIRARETGRRPPAADSAVGYSALRLPLAVLAGAVAGYVASLPVSPLFVADARIIVGAGASSAGPGQFNAGVVENSAAILGSRELASHVIERHGLARMLDPGLGQSLLGTVLIAAGLGSNPSHSSIEERALDRLENGLAIAPVGGSRVIEIRYSAADPDVAATVANAVADTFINDRVAGQHNSGRTALQWLESEIEQLRKRVAEADGRLERYRSGSALFEVPTEGGLASLAAQELSALNAELARARAAHAEAKARANVVRKILKEGGSVEAAREVLGSPLVQRLRQQQVDLQSQKAELSSTYLSDHPRIESLQSLLDDLDRQISSEIRKVLKSVELSAELAAARVSSLRESVNELKSAASRTNDKGVELRALEQDARSQRELLETFLTRHRILAAEAGSTPRISDAHIISRAKRPDRASSPNRPLWAAGGALAALLYLFLAAVFRRLASPASNTEAAHDADEIAALLLAAQRRQSRNDHLRNALDASETDIPPPDDRSASAGDRPTPAPVEARHGDRARTARSSAEAGAGHASAAPAGDGEPPPDLSLIDQAPGTAELGKMLADSTARVVLFAGAGARQASDSLALAAAARAADADNRLVVLDIGMRPSAALTIDRNLPGLGDLISGASPFGRVIRRDIVPFVDTIGMGRARGNPPLKRLATAIESLAKRYSRVIVVAERTGDWPDQVIRPDLAVIVCDPQMDDRMRLTVYRDVINRGARQALIVRNELASQRPEQDKAA